MANIDENAALKILSQVIMCNLVDFPNPGSGVLGFTLLEYSGVHYNSIEFRDVDTDPWKTYVEDFVSLPEAVREFIFFCCFILPMRDVTSDRG